MACRILFSTCDSFLTIILNLFSSRILWSALHFYFLFQTFHSKTNRLEFSFLILLYSFLPPVWFWNRVHGLVTMESAEWLESNQIWSHIFDSERYVHDSLNFSLTSVCLDKVLTYTLHQLYSLPHTTLLSIGILRPHLLRIFSRKHTFNPFSQIVSTPFKDIFLWANTAWLFFGFP